MNDPGFNMKLAIEDKTAAALSVSLLAELLVEVRFLRTHVRSMSTIVHSLAVTPEDKARVQKQLEEHDSKALEEDAAYVEAKIKELQAQMR